MKLQCRTKTADNTLKKMLKRSAKEDGEAGCEGYTDDEATTQKTGKEIRADKGTMSNWHSGYPQSIGLLMINTCGLAWHSGYPQRSS